MQTQKTEKINVLNLVKEYNMRVTDKLKSDYLKSTVHVKNYLGYAQKVVLADNIIGVSCLDKNMNIHIDSCKRYILYVYTIITNYTNINMRSDENIFADYDLLDSNGLVEKILALIPEKEINTFTTILDMKQNDLMTNQYEPHAFITKKMYDAFPELSKVITPLAEKLSDKLNGLDEKKIEKMIKKIANNAF